MVHNIIIGIIATISIITAIWVVMGLLKGKKATTKEVVATPAKTVIHRIHRPKFSIIPSTPEDIREKEVDKLLNKKNLSYEEQLFIYEYLLETGKEKWRYIKGYEGYYRINTYGVVESCRYDRLMEPTMLKNGAYAVSLTVDGEHKFCSLHRLVAETFIPNPSGVLRVKPKDGNYSNCDVRNLEWYKKDVPAKVSLAA